MSWPSRFENLEESSQAMIHSLSKETEKRLTPIALPEMNLPTPPSKSAEPLLVVRDLMKALPERCHRPQRSKFRCFPRRRLHYPRRLRLREEHAAKHPHRCGGADRGHRAYP